MALLQRYLGWVQRFFYQVESQSPPFSAGEIVVPTLEIGTEWPIAFQRILITYTTIAGTVVQTIVDHAGGGTTNTPEGHSRIVFLDVTKDAAGTFPAADTIGMNLQINGLGVPLINYQGVALDFTPLVGCISGDQMAAFGQQLRGLPTLYVPPGCALQLTHTSAVAGNAATILGIRVSREKSLPLPAIF